MNSSKSNGHNPLRVEPAKSYLSTVLDFAVMDKLLASISTNGYHLNLQEASHV